MKKLKVMTIVGTRPEIIRLSETIKKCDQYFEHILVHTGQNYDYSLNEVFFNDLGLREPDIYMGVVGENLGQTMGNVIAKSYEIMTENRPDAILILGDTNSALCAVSAKRLKIPIFHMEAGNRCFDQNLPEEINRKIVDHISDINLPYTEHARRYLISEGIRKDHIFVTGSPLKEVISKNMDRVKSSKVLEKLNLEKNKYILVSAHREENMDNDENLFGLVEALNTVAEEYNMPIIYSIHPRSKKKVDEKGIKFHELIKPMTPFGFIEYNCLQMNSFCVLSDSGTLSEESAMLGFTGISIRTSTERPEVLDKGSVIIGGIKKVDVLQSIEIAKLMEENKEETVLATDYCDENVSVKVIKIIQSYTKIVNKVIWDK